MRHQLNLRISIPTSPLAGVYFFENHLAKFPVLAVYTAITASQSTKLPTQKHKLCTTKDLHMEI